MGLFGKDIRREPLGLAAFFLFVCLAGGAGPHAPILLGIIESIGLLVVLRLLSLSGRIAAPAPAGVAGMCILLLILGLCAVQLVPLSWATTCVLPGRALLCDTATLLGQANRSRPLSLLPDETIASALTLLAPIASFVTILVLPDAARRTAVRVAIAAGAISALLGVAQGAASDGSFFLYALPPFERAPGIFANYNHQATFLNATLVLLAADWLASGREPAALSAARLALAILLVVGVVFTSSRSGLLLLALALAAILCLWLGANSGQGHRSEHRRGRRRGLWMAMGAVTLAVALLIPVLTGSYRYQVMTRRIADTAQDGRLSFWPNVVYARDLYWPAGSGVGTFDMVYQAAEPLADVASTRVNHAHNDYLEIALEAGLPGVILIALFLAWFLWRAVRAWTARARGADIIARGASVVVTIILVHSLVDYPLRTQTIACLMAIACGLLVPTSRRHEPEVSPSGRHAADAIT